MTVEPCDRSGSFPEQLEMVEFLCGTVYAEGVMRALEQALSTRRAVEDAASSNDWRMKSIQAWRTFRVCSKHNDGDVGYANFIYLPSLWSLFRSCGSICRAIGTLCGMRQDYFDPEWHGTGSPQAGSSEFGNAHTHAPTQVRK